MKLAGMIGLVPVPVLDHELGHLAIDEELERLVAHLLAHDGVDAHGGEPIPRYAPGYARGGISGISGTHDTRNHAVSV